MKKAICSTICAVIVGMFAAGVLTGCNRESDVNGLTSSGTAGPTPSEPLATTATNVTRSLQESISGVSQDVLTALGPHAEALKNLSTDEVMKLFRWTYRVEEFAPSFTAAALEDELNRLGKENWECFSIVSSPSGIRVTCKKRPMSAVNYLQYIPGM
jgi:hypothetical protein